MATDLEFRQTQLPAIRLRPIKISSNLKPLCSNNNIHNINNNKDLRQGCGCSEEEDEVESSVVTPTSAESKIPTNFSCPPAPIKPRRVVPSKRKLSDELQFFEITSHGRDQVESFFRSTSSNIITRRFKKTKTHSIE